VEQTLSFSNPQSTILNRKFPPFVSSFVSRKRNSSPTGRISSPGASRSSVDPRNDWLGFYQCGSHKPENKRIKHKDREGI
jgi:hypothetical protein